MNNQQLTNAHPPTPNLPISQSPNLHPLSSTLYPPPPASEPAYLILALILPIFALAPLFYPGYIQTHQGLVPLWNIADLRANWGHLSWTPHLALHFDPLRSDGLLPYYLAALLPGPPAAAAKMVVGLSWLAGCLGMFLWLREWLGGPGALIAALVYTYLPYQISAVYVRGAWGETLFWGLLPWILPAFSIKQSSPLFSLLWLLLGLSQLGLAIWALLFAVLLLLVIQPARSALFAISSALLGTTGAAALYLFLGPLFTAAPTPFVDHFLYPFQLFSAYWGFGPSRPGWQDGLSFQLGLAAVGLTLLGIFLWRGHEARTMLGPNRRPAFFLGGGLVLILLQFQPSLILWHLPIWPGQTLANTLTYPWQLSGLVGLCLSVLAGAALRLAPAGQFSRPPLFGAIIILIILSVYPYLRPQFIQLNDYPLDRPQAELGQAQLTILDHSFAVVTSGHTAGLKQGQITIPLAAHGPLQANDTLVMNVVWQPLRPFDRDLKVFVHLVDTNNNILAQFDGQPQAGTYPTSTWIPGEMIADAYPMIVPAAAPPGPYRVFIGLYDEPALQRLPVPTDAAGRVIFNVQ